MFDPPRYAQRRGWKVDLLTYTEAETGGYKEVIAQVRCRLPVWPPLLAKSVGLALICSYFNPAPTFNYPIGDW